MENKKYIVIRSKNMANTMAMVTGQRPYVYNANFEDGKEVWSFINDESFQEAFKIINDLINKNRQ